MMRRAFIQFTRGRVGCGVVAGCKGAAHQSAAHRCAFRWSRNPGEQPWRSQKIIRGARLRGGRERCLRRPVGGRMDRAVAGARRRARRAWRGCADHGRLRGNASREAGIRFECDRVSGPSYPVEEGLISSFARPGANISLLPIKAGAKIVDIGCGMVSRRVLRRRICAARDNERAGSIPLLRGSLSSRPDRRFLCTEPLPVAQ